MKTELSHKANKAKSVSRHELAPETHDAFRQFSKVVFEEGSLSRRSKQLIAVAVAHVTQYPYCIRGHTKAATELGASPEQIMEAIWVAAEMRAGGAFAHAGIALETFEAGPHAHSEAG